jgi:hypothetical protein
LEANLSKIFDPASKKIKLEAMVHTCNFRNMRGRGRRILVQGPPQAES